jgi:hypothetical protein
MRQRSTPTHGEAWLERKENLDFSLSISKMASTFEKPLPQRMSRDKAMRYYKAKLRNVFGIPDVEFIAKAVPDEFMKVEHYYDYHEALRLVA